MQTKSKTHQTVLLPKDLISALRDASKEERRSINKTAEIAISQWLLHRSNKGK